MPVILTLADGSTTLVDDEDALFYGGMRLSAHSAGYVRAGRSYLHRLICCPSAGQVVDHINGDKRDNRRQNLRACRQNQNLWNAGKKSHNRSGFLGVYFCKQTSRWRAEIRADGQCFKIGRFGTAQEAAQAYDNLATTLHGEFARLNFAPTSGGNKIGRGCE